MNKKEAEKNKANLREADLTGADLTWAKGVFIFNFGVRLEVKPWTRFIPPFDVRDVQHAENQGNATDKEKGMVLYEKKESPGTQRKKIWIYGLGYLCRGTRLYVFSWCSVEFYRNSERNRYKNSHKTLVADMVMKTKQKVIREWLPAIYQCPDPDQVGHFLYILYQKAYEDGQNDRKD